MSSQRVNSGTRIQTDRTEAGAHLYLSDHVGCRRSGRSALCLCIAAISAERTRSRNSRISDILVEYRTLLVAETKLRGFGDRLRFPLLQSFSQNTTNKSYMSLMRWSVPRAT